MSQSSPQRPTDPEVEAASRGIVKRGRGRPKGRKDRGRRKGRARAPPPDDPDSQTIGLFCIRNMLSRAMYNRLRVEGRGPREIKFAQKVLITREAAADWRKQMEDETAKARSAAEQKEWPDREVGPSAV